MPARPIPTPLMSEGSEFCGRHVPDVPKANNVPEHDRFDGVKMGAKIKVNGVEIGETTDQFRRYVFPLDKPGLLKDSGWSLPGGGQRSYSTYRPLKAVDREYM